MHLLIIPIIQHALPGLTPSPLLRDAANANSTRPHLPIPSPTISSLPRILQTKLLLLVIVVRLVAHARIPRLIRI